MLDALKVQSQEEFHYSQFMQDVLEGLTQKEKKLNPKYFYDESGSAFFDQICELDEYYPYKTELGLLPSIASELAEVLNGDYAVVEFGAGSLQKIKPLLKEINSIRRFVPIDISGEHLQVACDKLQQDFPALQMHPIEADFCQPVTLDRQYQENKLGFFPGSTIGNFTPQEARNFLANARATLGKGGYLLIGVDTKKSPKKLHAAYNDKKGVTAKFNLNMLERINREFDTDIATDQFEHYAFYNAQKGCIEMHLVSLVEQSLELAGVDVDFYQGESIHTESSYKYAPHEFQVLAGSAGWSVTQSWLAEDNMFSTFLLHNDC